MKLTPEQFERLREGVTRIIGRPQNEILPNGDYKWVIQTTYGPVSIYIYEHGPSIHWYFDRHAKFKDYRMLETSALYAAPKHGGTWHIYPAIKGVGVSADSAIGANLHELQRRITLLCPTERPGRATRGELVSALRGLLDEHVLIGEGSNWDLDNDEIVAEARRVLAMEEA